VTSTSSAPKKPGSSRQTRATSACTGNPKRGGRTRSAPTWRRAGGRTTPPPTWWIWAICRLCAEFHGKLDADLFAEQLHYLGRWFNTALLAVETGGGYGEAVLIPLRDGRAGRRPYPKLYRHILSNRPDLPQAKPFGFPMNTKTRPLAVSSWSRRSVSGTSRS
jgi:hypothetical protein